jgi:hypothetical protein
MVERALGKLKARTAPAAPIIPRMDRNPQGKWA